MRAPVKHLPAEERRAVTVETLIEPAGEQNPSVIIFSTLTIPDGNNTCRKYYRTVTFSALEKATVVIGSP
ncbi:MAG: hypothetical protein SCH71_17235 [Desulfobulbaceae bacterium]|nr:hypothetical protein [Desulfobulbaceae bacterium]